jgi:hypothetical protein
MNVVGHERETNLSFRCIVCILWVLTVFLYGCVKRSVLGNGDGLRFVIFTWCIVGDDFKYRPQYTIR